MENNGKWRNVDKKCCQEKNGNFQIIRKNFRKKQEKVNKKFYILSK